MATELATAYIQLVPSARGIQGNIAKEFSGVPDVADRAGRESGSRFSRGFKVAGAALGVGLAAIFKTGIDEQSDFLSGQAQLTAGLKSTGGVAGITVDQMENLASSIQNYSGQTDDSIVASEKLLLTFTGIRNTAGANNDIFTQATKISADMAARMGGDASGSAIQLGKALNDPVKGLTALSKIGVSFTDGQKKQVAAMVKSGNTIGAQKVILGELNKEFGGSAKAAGDTLPGQLARAKRSFEDVSQSVVAGLMPVLTKLGTVLTTYIMPAFTKVVGFITAHQTAFLVLAGVIGTIVATLKIWAVVQAVLNAVIAANPIVLIVAALAALAVGLVIAYKRSATFRDIVNSVFAVIKTVVLAVVSSLVTAFHALMTAGSAVWTVIQAVWNSVGRPLFSAIATVIGVELAIAKAVFRGVVVAFEALWSAVQAEWAVGKAVFNAIKSAVQTVASVAKAGFSAVSTAWSAMSGVFRSIFSSVIKPVLKLLVDSFLSVVSTIVHGAASMFGWVPGVGGKLKSAASKIDQFRHEANNSFNNIGKNPIKPNVQTGAARAAVRSFGSWYENYLGTLTGTIPAPRYAGGAKPGKAGGVIGVHATGGLTTGPHIALVGDNPGGRELIMPMQSPNTISLLAKAMDKAGSAPSATGTPVQLTINPRANQSEMEIGKAAASEIRWALRS